MTYPPTVKEIEEAFDKNRKEWCEKHNRKCNEECCEIFCRYHPQKEIYDKQQIN